MRTYIDHRRKPDSDRRYSKHADRLRSKATDSSTYLSLTEANLKRHTLANPASYKSNVKYYLTRLPTSFEPLLHHTTSKKKYRSTAREVARHSAAAKTVDTADQSVDQRAQVNVTRNTAIPAGFGQRSSDTTRSKTKVTGTLQSRHPVKVEHSSSSASDSIVLLPRVPLHQRRQDLDDKENGSRPYTATSNAVKNDKSGLSRTKTKVNPVVLISASTRPERQGKRVGERGQGMDPSVRDKERREREQDLQARKKRRQAKAAILNGPIDARRASKAEAHTNIIDLTGERDRPRRKRHRQPSSDASTSSASSEGARNHKKAKREHRGKDVKAEMAKIRGATGTSKRKLSKPMSRASNIDPAVPRITVKPKSGIYHNGLSSSKTRVNSREGPAPPPDLAFDEAPFLDPPRSKSKPEVIKYGDVVPDDDPEDSQQEECAPRVLEVAYKVPLQRKRTSSRMTQSHGDKMHETGDERDCRMRRSNSEAPVKLRSEKAPRLLMPGDPDDTARTNEADLSAASLQRRAGDLSSLGDLASERIQATTPVMGCNRMGSHDCDSASLDSIDLFAAPDLGHTDHQPAAKVGTAIIPTKKRTRSHDTLVPERSKPRALDPVEQDPDLPAIRESKGGPATNDPVPIQHPQQQSPVKLSRSTGRSKTLLTAESMPTAEHQDQPAFLTGLEDFDFSTLNYSPICRDEFSHICPPDVSNHFSFLPHPDESDQDVCEERATPHISLTEPCGTTFDHEMLDKGHSVLRGSGSGESTSQDAQAARSSMEPGYGGVQAATSDHHQMDHSTGADAIILADQFADAKQDEAYSFFWPEGMSTQIVRNTLAFHEEEDLNLTHGTLSEDRDYMASLIDGTHVSLSSVLSNPFGLSISNVSPNCSHDMNTFLNPSSPDVALGYPQPVVQHDTTIPKPSSNLPKGALHNFWQKNTF